MCFQREHKNLVANSFQIGAIGFNELVAITENIIWIFVLATGKERCLFVDGFDTLDLSH